MCIACLQRCPASLGKAVGMTRICAALLVTLLSVGIASAQDTVIYYHTDAIGSVRMITDASGGVLERFDYLPFGGDCAPNPPCAAQPPDTKQFAGKDRDTDTAFDYFGARYYEAVNGRFTSVDPEVDVQKALVEPQLWNRYTYVTNNPLRFKDPDGRQREAALDRDVQALLAKQITVEEYNARIQARGIGGALGALVVAGPVAWRVAVGCFLSPACQAGTINAAESFAGAPPTPLSSLALLDEAIAVVGSGALSKAGQALQSHASRGGWFAGKAFAGNAAQNTAAAKELLQMFFTYGKRTYGKHPEFGDVTYIRLPDGAGAWWKTNGEFIGFLEAYSKQ